MIETLFGDGVVTVLATPEMWSHALHPEEASCSPRAGSPRRRGFTAGRACAREALGRLGVRDFPLCSGDDRLPLWPPGIVGSISHCRDCCGVAVARRTEIAGIGLDIEQTGRLEESLLRRICRASELEEIVRLTREDGAVDWGTAFFSAKESTYKCYYPLSRTILEFHDLEVFFDASQGSFRADLTRPELPAARGQRSFRGRLAADARHVCTGLTLADD